MDDLVTWLRAQLDEDERVALAVPPSFDLFDGTGIIVMHANTGTRSVTLPSNVAIFAARHDPARVLREVESKRRILDLHAPVLVNFGDETACTECGRAPMNAPCQTLLLLALPYADRPGYRAEEWKP